MSYLTTTCNYMDEPRKHVEQMNCDTIYAAQIHLNKVQKQAKSYINAKITKKRKEIISIKVRIMVTSREEGKYYNWERRQWFRGTGNVLFFKLGSSVWLFTLYFFLN